MRFCFYLILLLFSVSCANKTLIRDTEYQPVYQALKLHDAKDALRNFPEKEQNGFITTFEKAWIRFWSSSEKFSDGDIQIIQNLSDQINKRKFISISHEATVFLVGESEDGYIPSEHEIISLHLFLAMLYLDVKKFDSAHVELKRAVEYLANNPEGNETTFDDAAIRIWLASLWEAIGNRNASDVDLRKAMELSGVNLNKVLENSKRDVQLLMTGFGPKVKWSEGGEIVNFQFHLPTAQEYLFSTNDWYSWHKKRNTKIRDSLVKSHYMTVALGHETSNFSKKTAGFAAISLLTVAGIAVVAGSVYACIQLPTCVSSTDAYQGLLGLTLLTAAFVVEKGDQIATYVDKQITASNKDRAEFRKTYRMIRFLPSNIEYIDENLDKSSKRYISGYRKTLGTGHNQVEFIWNPE